MTRKRLAAAVAALTVVAVVMTAGLASARSTASLSGAGSTFVAPLVQAWEADYAKSPAAVTVTYGAIGSGGGIDQIEQDRAVRTRRASDSSSAGTRTST